MTYFHVIKESKFRKENMISMEYTQGNGVIIGIQNSVAPMEYASFSVEDVKEIINHLNYMIQANEQ